jgi:hypothetical protein
LSTRRRKHGYGRFSDSFGHGFLSYKAERDVKMVVEVNPRRTIQEGYKYGKEVKKKFCCKKPQRSLMWIRNRQGLQLLVSHL